MKRVRLRKSLLSQIVSKLFNLAVAIGIGGWTARYLGSSVLGTLSYVSALVGLLGPLGNMGMKESLSALLCTNKQVPGLLGTALCIELLGTGLITLVLAPVALFSHDAKIPYLLGLAILANLFNSAEVFESQLFNQYRGTRVGFADFIQTLIGTVAAVAALFLEAPLWCFGALPAVQNFVRGLSLYLSAGATSLLGLLRSARWPAARELISRGWPLMLSSLTVMIYMKSDIVMLQWMSSSEQVGQYSVAVRVAESLYFLPAVLGQTFLPSLSQKSDDLARPQLNQDAWDKLCKTSWILGICMAFGTLFAMPKLLMIVFGSQYNQSIVALKYLAPASIAICSGITSGVFFRLNNRMSFLVARTALGAVANIVLNAVLIPRQGIAGAAAATSIAHFVAAYLFGLACDETRRLHLYLLNPWNGRQCDNDTVLLD